MALGYLLNPALQIEDTDGKPLTGGYLTVYQHGTTIPYITYKDFSGDRNPANIPLDAKGMAVVLASDGFAYDVYCYDRNAVQQWSRLNVTTSVVGVDGLYTFTSSDGTVGITTTTAPNEPTEIDLSAQQLTAGPNIDIINGVVSTEKPVVNAGTNVTITSSSDPSTRTITYNVSAVDTTYSAGSGLNLNGNTFSVDTSTVQPKLTAGNNIYFEGNIINAVDTLPVAGYGLSQSAYNILAVDTSVIQPKLTAGTNVTISNDNVISAVDTFYQAGTGLNLTAGNTFNVTDPIPPHSSAQADRVLTVESDGTIGWETAQGGNTYTAGNGIDISNANVVSAKIASNSGLENGSSGLSVYNKVPNSPGQYHYLRTSGPEHADWYWEPLIKTKFTGNVRAHVLTADDITNGYCDLQTDWGLPLASGSPMEGHVPNHLTASRFVFFLDMSDADYLNGTGSNGLSSQVDYIESGIWSDEYPSFYGCELFEPIQASEIVRVPGHPYFPHDVRKLGMSRLYVDMYGPAFRVHFAQNHVLQAGYTVGLAANVVGVYLPEIWF